jgi:hypothetical protein
VTAGGPNASCGACTHLAIERVVVAPAEPEAQIVSARELLRARPYVIIDARIGTELEAIPKAAYNTHRPRIR